MKVRKMTLWFKDESGQEFTAHMWGRRFVDKGKDIAVGSGATMLCGQSYLPALKPVESTGQIAVRTCSVLCMTIPQDLVLGNYRPCRRHEARHSPRLGSRQLLRVG